VGFGPPAAAEAGASAAVFHAPQAGQRPNQRADSWPQLEQKKWLEVFFFDMSFLTGDVSCRGRFSQEGDAPAVRSIAA
jgi:hypothetical protein